MIPVCLHRARWLSTQSVKRVYSTATTSSTHVPVMLPQVVDFLQPKPGAVYCDATYGDGGYTRAILGGDPFTCEHHNVLTMNSHCLVTQSDSCDCKVVAIDQDPVAFDRAKLVADQEKYR